MSASSSAIVAIASTVRIAENISGLVPQPPRFEGVPHDLFRVHDWRTDVETLGALPASYVAEARMPSFLLGYKNL